MILESGLLFWATLYSGEHLTSDRKIAGSSLTHCAAKQAAHAHLRRQIFSYLPSFGASPPFHWYQVTMLPGDRGRCVGRTR